MRDLRDLKDLRDLRDLKDDTRCKTYKRRINCRTEALTSRDALRYDLCRIINRSKLPPRDRPEAKGNGTRRWSRNSLALLAAFRVFLLAVRFLRGLLRLACRSWLGVLGGVEPQELGADDYHRHEHLEERACEML